MKRLTERRKNGAINVRYATEHETAIHRLVTIEDILGDEYDLDRLSVLCNQRMTMRDEVSERFSLTAKIPLDRLRELAEADREGRCVVFPRLEPGQGDNPGEPGAPGPPGIATVATLKVREQE